MFENLFSRLKRKPSAVQKTEEPKPKEFKKKLKIIEVMKGKIFNKNKQQKIDDVDGSEEKGFDFALSPRAYDTEDYAITSLDWDFPPECFPNVLDKFTEVSTYDINSPRSKRTDREEIRKRLAFGLEYDEYAQSDRPGRKPSLHSRLQSGKNLQICYMNEAISDFDNLNIEKNERSSLQSLNSAELTVNTNVSKHLTRPLSVSSINKEKSAIPQGGKIRPSSLALRSKSNSSKSLSNIDVGGKDFCTVQARLQTEARIALAQAKEKARMEMENTRRTRASSPVAIMVRRSLAKTNCRLPESRRRLSRQFLTDMNLAQLQVIVNELHTQIETLNENLVQLLMARDDLHMTQDSRLVDIEDLTRYLEMKQLGSKGKSRSISSIIRPVN